MGSPARFPFGVTTAEKQQTLGFFGLPDPTKWHTYFDDFDRYAAADWTITAVGTGTSALGDVDGGALVITCSAADNDSRFHQKLGESFLLTAGKRTIFKARFKVSDATQSDFVFGLQVTDTTPLAAGGDGVTDGIFFQKDDGVATVDAYCQKDTTTGQLTKAAIATLANDTFVTLGWAYNGKTRIDLYVNDSAVAYFDLTTSPAAFLPDTELTVSYGIQNGEAVAKVMTIDYIFAAQER